MRAGAIFPPLLVLAAACPPGRTAEFLPVRLDDGPVILLATAAAGRDYAAAIAAAGRLHPGASRANLDPLQPEAVLPILRERRPRHAIVFILPEELDVNLAWRWLATIVEVDPDPFPDVRTGFITGATPAASADLVERIAAAAAGKARLPRALVDDLGPNERAPPAAFFANPGSFILPGFAAAVPSRTISHGKEGFTDGRLDSLSRAGILHFGGHGYPDRIVDGLTGRQAARLALDPCVVFNGACSTGVTGRWFEEWTAEGKVRERRVAAADSFCLSLLGNRVIGYLAALHPDHGIPVYQEMERLIETGGSLGDLILATQRAVVLGSGGKLPTIAPLEDGAPSRRRTPSEVMLLGTAARVLFGDPALRILEAGKPALRVATSTEEGFLRITATVVRPDLPATLTDTFHADLSADPNLFNARALVTADLPEGWTAVGPVEVLSAKAGGKTIGHRVIGFGVEEDGGARRLHVQVDLPSTGWMQSPWRKAGAEIVLRAGKGR